MKTLIIILFMAATALADSRGTMTCESFDHAMKSSLQVIAVTSDSWSSSHATITRYEKIGGRWQQVGNTVDGRLGKNGLGWGIGDHQLQEQNDKQFRIQNYRWEGDNKSPAGIFTLSAGFGVDQSLVASEAKKHNLFLPVVEELHCFDDSPSPYYNRFVIDANADSGAIKTPYVPAIPHDAITDSEHMIEMTGDRTEKFKGWNPYTIGIFVNHNSAAQKADSEFTLGEWRAILYPSLGKDMSDSKIQAKLQSKDPAPYGSCIFLHVINPDPNDAGTAGCTSMPFKDMHDVLMWRDSRKHPILIQLPAEQWADLSRRCQSPLPL